MIPPTARFGLISDTHGWLHPDVHEHFAGVQAIFHAGDVGGQDILNELALIAPVNAVVGNTDDPWQGLPLDVAVTTPAGVIAARHGHLEPSDPARRVEGLLGHFIPVQPRVLVYGHSHLQHLELRRGVWIVNPGSAGKPRLNTVPTVCVMEWWEVGNRLAFHYLPIGW